MIGQKFRDDRRRGALALAAGLALAALPFHVLVFAPWAPGQGGTYLVIAVAVVWIQWRLAGGDFETLGLRTTVDPSWQFWVRGAALIGLAVGVIVVGYMLVSGAYRDISFDGPTFDTWQTYFPNACIYAPVMEELTYRVALCSALVAWIGRWPTVFVSGAVFGLVHFVYGTAGPDNFVAGYFFAWAYLRSGSVAIPIALHAGGNLVAILLRPHM